jgi:cyclomaltodextrinase / maltogenic alpha-amylase / neopullulanase
VSACRLATFSALLALLAVPLAGAQPLRPLPLVAGAPDSLVVADLVVGDARVVFASTEAVEVISHNGVVVLTPRADFEGLALVPYATDGTARALPVRVRRLIPHTFTYPASPAAERVHVIGQFNDWSRSRHPLVRQPDGSWSLTLDLDPGRYEYKFTVDGAEVLDPGNPERVPNPFGDFNNILVVPPRHAEALALHVVGFAGGEVELAFERGGRPADVGAMEVIALLDGTPLGTHRFRTAGDRLFVHIGPHDEGTLLVATTGGGQSTRMASIPLRDGAPLPTDAFTWNDAVIYQIMVDRFHDGDRANTRPVPHDSVATRANYHGGDLQGILDRMEEGYFDRLGVNTLWLSPVVQNTDRAHREYPPPYRYYTGYHGYWPTHPTEVEERFGDMALLERLVREARGRGMRVLLDFVANHIHEDHPFFREHSEWFGTLELPDGRLNLRKWDEHRLTTWFEPYLPSFDFEGSTDAVEAMTDNAVWWLLASGADGFRHDAVKHIPNHFWRTLTRKVREQVDSQRDVRAFQIGETFGSYDLIASYVNTGQLDAQFNFNLYDTALYAFLDPDADFAVLDSEMHRTLDVYGVDHLMGNLMDSHDKPRFPALVEGHVPDASGDDKEPGWHSHITVEDPATYGRVELYLAYLLTIPGVPTIYYGNEIGKTGANDPDNRRPMRFGEELAPEERELKERVSRLIGLRRDLPALRRGGFHTLHAAGDTWAYLRDGVDSRVVVALNKGVEAATLRLALPAALVATSGVDALSGEAVEVSGDTLVIGVPAGSYRVVALGGF